MDWNSGLGVGDFGVLVVIEFDLSVNGLVGCSRTRIRISIIPDPCGPTAWMSSKSSDIINVHYFHKIKSKFHRVLNSDAIGLIS